MKNNGRENTKAEIEPKFKHFLLAMLIIFSFTSPFFIIGGNSAKKWNEYLKTNGKETLAFYAYPAGRMSSTKYIFEYKINGNRYTASLKKLPVLPPNCPFKELPIMVRYAEEKPSRSIVLPDKTFNYKGYKIKWITHEKSRQYYMLVEKIE
jgi:hypothetical protein